jgi:DNA helicase II / ATP-dependent DNA helicase PcrA
MDYLQELNEQQREAVLHSEGALMIVAGAGSGKTKVLTTRIAHLMKNGVDAFNILALTFTNKAAAEMKERINKILGGSEARNLYIGTFHSVFARILRYEAEVLNYAKNFTIYDTDDSKSVLRAIIKEHGYDEKIYKVNAVYNRISAAKNNLIVPVAYQGDYDIQQEDARANRPGIGKLYEAYVNKCFKNNAMDFDDILVNMYLLLAQHPEAMARYQHRFKYLMIDEYQDTNLAQYHIIKLIAAVHENICVVGDDAQSIYSFRGASMQNIFQFQKDYADFRLIKLEQNYRSTNNILEAANAVIAKNSNQIPKSLWTTAQKGDTIRIVQNASDADEARFVASTIAEYKLRFHFSNIDFAILYRTNAQSRSFEENLRRLGVKYRIYGGMSFYQRKEIKDFIAYMRSVINPQDEEAVKRIINVPARGVGTTSLQKISIYAGQQGITFWDGLLHAEQAGIKGTTLAAVQRFVLLIQSAQAQLAAKNAFDIAMILGKESGLVHELQNDKTVEGLARFENIEELINSIRGFTETPTEDGEIVDKDLGAYLQQISLLTDADKEEEDADCVKLMTVHAAKGLEFPCVFVVGMEEELFPSNMSMYDRDDLEEERRLFYVAITRAKQKLWLTVAQHRYRFGTLISNKPSRFLAELPDAVVEYNRQELPAQQAAVRPGGWGGAAAKPSYAEPTVAQKKSTIVHVSYQHEASADFKPSNPLDIGEGMRVEHQRFGFGVVQKLEGGKADSKAVIVFEQGVGEKKMMLNFAKLRIVEEVQ